ncbi:MAG: SIMPL domain-containing protein [bacterium]|nr:SIMPL domain-containing protein [bacterium]
MLEENNLNNRKNVIFAAVIIGGLFYLGGQYVGSQPQRIQQEAAANREITVEGTGEVTTVPDIAQINLGVQTGAQTTASAAISILETKFNAVVASVKKDGVKEEDIKATNLSINPVYDYSDGRQQLRGYEASESVQVKIRDLDRIGDIVTKATGEGANQVGGISFTIDDPEDLRLQAQEEAIKNAKSKADELAKALGVHLGQVKTFSASTQVPDQPPIYARAALENDAVGGGVEVPAGSQDVTATVTVTYEIK